MRKFCKEKHHYHYMDNYRNIYELNIRNFTHYKMLSEGGRLYNSEVFTDKDKKLFQILCLFKKINGKEI